MRFFFLLTAPSMLLLGAQCSSSPKSQPTDNKLFDNSKWTFVETNDTFLLPDIPKKITDVTKRTEYLSVHFWTYFDFKNSTLIKKSQVTEQALVDYINILNFLPQAKTDVSLVATLRKAEKNNAMYLHFLSLFDKYFYEPNSPFRNEERYIVVLKEVLSSSQLSNEETKRRRFQWEMIRKNRLGTKAANFKYTLPSGNSHDLYAIDSDFLILMFSNPNCHTCRSVMTQIKKSHVLRNVFSRNTSSRKMLQVLTIYPDEEPQTWIEYANQTPPEWIYAYDKGAQIIQKKLYDIRATPTLYLLDKNKKVILKDTSFEAIEDFFSIT